MDIGNSPEGGVPNTEALHSMRLCLVLGFSFIWLVFR